MRALLVMLIFALALSGGPLSADSGGSPLFSEPAFAFELPVPLLRAIAKVESGVKPWTLNIAGRGYWYESKDGALAAARAALRQGLSVDVGMMQINSFWLRKYGISPEAALDPLANVYFGAWILRQELDRLGDMRAAIGSYHSPKPEKAENYARIVLSALEAGHKSSRGALEADPSASPASDLGSLGGDPPAPEASGDGDPPVGGSAAGEAEPGAAPQESSEDEPDPAGSPMLVQSPYKALASDDSMMASFNRSSMKIGHNLKDPK
jgi:hypothetical protein